MGEWHGKNISKSENLKAAKRVDSKNPYGHLIDSKLGMLKKKAPELKEIIKRISAKDYCRYEPDNMNEIKIDLLDPSFPPNPASIKKKK